MWVAIFIGFGLFSLFAIGYVWSHFGRFAIIERLSGGKKWARRLLAAIPTAAIIAYVVMDTIPAVVALTHLVIIWIIIEFIFKIIHKYINSGKYHKAHYNDAVNKEHGSEAVNWEYDKLHGKRIYLPGVLALTITGVYLTIAWYFATTVVPVNYTIETDKLGDGEKFRLVMFTDSHIGCTFDGEKMAEYIHEMGELNPDALVIVGDYVDDDTTKEDMIAATKAFSEITTTYGVYYVFGNHDPGYYNGRDFNEDDLRIALQDAGVYIMEDAAVQVNDKVTIVGRHDRSNPYRADISEIMELVDKDTYSIVLDHQPNDQKAEREAGADLVLSGHTHGGQLIPINYMGEFFGLNDQTKGLRVVDNTTYIVSSGISDWAIPFKTGCRSEYQIIDIE